MIKTIMLAAAACVGAGAQRPDGVGAGDPGVRFAGSGQDFQRHSALSTPRLNRVIRGAAWLRAVRGGPPRLSSSNQPATTYDWHGRDVSPY